MRKIMVFQHVAHEPLGTLNPMLKAAGFRIRYINFGRNPDIVPSLDGYSGLIILGGPMGVYEAGTIPHLITEMKMIEHALKADIPILGICLGSQLIAHVLGACVRKADASEVGWHGVHLSEHAQTDPLFSIWQSSEKIFQLHQDTFDLPTQSTHLARSDLFEGQAFRYGSKVYGFQFHLEADKAMIHRWLAIAGNRYLFDSSAVKVTHEQLILETEKNIAHSLKLSRETFSKFIEIFQLPERPLILDSGHGKPRRQE